MADTGTVVERLTAIVDAAMRDGCRHGVAVYVAPLASRTLHISLWCPMLAGIGYYPIPASILERHPGEGPHRPTRPLVANGSAHALDAPREANLRVVIAEGQRSFAPHDLPLSWVGVQRQGRAGRMGVVV